MLLLPTRHTQGKQPSRKNAQFESRPDERISILVRPQSSIGSPTEFRSTSLTLDAVIGLLKVMACTERCPAKRYNQVRRRTIIIDSSWWYFYAFNNARNRARLRPEEDIAAYPMSKLNSSGIGMLKIVLFGQSWAPPPIKGTTLQRTAAEDK
jgi:hypothetical protein